MDAPVAIADPRGPNLLDPSFQAGRLAATGFVMIGGPIEFQDRARPPDRDAPIIANRRRQRAVRDVGAGATDLDRINERPHSFWAKSVETDLRTSNMTPRTYSKPLLFW